MMVMEGMGNGSDRLVLYRGKDSICYSIIIGRDIIYLNLATTFRQNQRSNDGNVNSVGGEQFRVFVLWFVMVELVRGYGDNVTDIKGFTSLYSCICMLCEGCDTCQGYRSYLYVFASREMAVICCGGLVPRDQSRGDATTPQLLQSVVPHYQLDATIYF